MDNAAESECRLYNLMAVSALDFSALGARCLLPCKQVWRNSVTSYIVVRITSPYVLCNDIHVPCPPFGGDRLGTTREKKEAAWFVDV